MRTLINRLVKVVVYFNFTCFFDTKSYEIAMLQRDQESICPWKMVPFPHGISHKGEKGTISLWLI